MKYTLNDLCNFEKGKTGIQKAIPGAYPLVVTGSERKSSSDYQFDCEAVCVPLVSSTGHGHKSINYIHYQSGKFALGTILVALIPKDKELLSAEYLREYLLAYKEEKIVSLMKGGANVTLPIKALKSLSVEVPSIKEQRKIVDKVKKVRHLIIQTNENCDLALDKLTAFKSSLISEAIRGKLVPQDLNDEPAEKLLERIKLKKDNLVKDGKLRKEKMLPDILDGEVPYKIPENWVWTRLNSATEAIIDCPHSTPHYLENVTGYYGIDTNCINAKGEICKLRNLSRESYELRTKRLIPEVNDIIYSREGSIGLSAFVPEKTKICMGQRVMLIRGTSSVIPQYIKLYISSSVYIKKLLKKHRGIGAKHVNVSDILMSVIAVPPLNEQVRIVEKVSGLFDICDTQEKNIVEAKNKLDLLNKAILREMFE